MPNVPRAPSSAEIQVQRTLVENTSLAAQLADLQSTCAILQRKNIAMGKRPATCAGDGAGSSPNTLPIQRPITPRRRRSDNLVRVSDYVPSDNGTSNRPEEVRQVEPVRPSHGRVP
eukprot:gene1019-12708_t